MPGVRHNRPQPPNLVKGFFPEHFTFGSLNRNPGSGGYRLFSGCMVCCLFPQDVMVVGEPTLMGGEFGDEDERLITRLENAQFEQNPSEEDINQANLSADHLNVSNY